MYRWVHYAWSQREPTRANEKWNGDSNNVVNPVMNTTAILVLTRSPSGIHRIKIIIYINNIICMAHGRVYHNSIINKSQSLSEEPIQTTKTNEVYQSLHVPIFWDTPQFPAFHGPFQRPNLFSLCQALERLSHSLLTGTPTDHAEKGHWAVVGLWDLNDFQKWDVSGFFFEETWKPTK